MPSWDEIHVNDDDTANRSGNTTDDAPDPIAVHDNGFNYVGLNSAGQPIWTDYFGNKYGAEHMAGLSQMAGRGFGHPVLNKASVLNNASVLSGFHARNPHMPGMHDDDFFGPLIERLPAGIRPIPARYRPGKYFWDRNRQPIAAGDDKKADASDNKKASSDDPPTPSKKENVEPNKGPNPWQKSDSNSEETKKDIEKTADREREKAGDLSKFWHDAIRKSLNDKYIIYLLRNSIPFYIKIITEYGTFYAYYNIITSRIENSAPFGFDEDKAYGMEFDYTKYRFGYTGWNLNVPGLKNEKPSIKSEMVPITPTKKSYQIKFAGQSIQIVDEKGAAKVFRAVAEELKKNPKHCCPVKIRS